MSVSTEGWALSLVSVEGMLTPVLPNPPSTGIFERLAVTAAVSPVPPAPPPPSPITFTEALRPSTNALTVPTPAAAPPASMPPNPGVDVLFILPLVLPLPPTMLLLAVLPAIPSVPPLAEPAEVGPEEPPLEACPLTTVAAGGAGGAAAAAACAPILGEKKEAT